MLTHTEIDLDTELLAAAQEALGTSQPAETIQRALQEVVDQHKQNGFAIDHLSESARESRREIGRHELSNLIIDESAQPLLTRTARALLDRLLPEMDRIAREHHMDVTRVEVSGFFFYDDGSQELVVTQFVDADAGMALDYWEALIESLTDWSRSLPARQAKLFEDRMGIDVEWNADDADTAAV